MTANGIVELTDANFDPEISKGLTLVDFWAPWCGPCRMQTPILERVAPKVAGKAKIAKLNVDEAAEPPARFGVRAIPTLILFKDGKAVQQFVGVQPEGTLISAIEAAGS